MLKRHITRATVLVLLIIAISAVFSCDTTHTMDPYVFIDVYLDPVAHPVGDLPTDGKLIIYMYVDSTWTAYYLTATYSTNLIYLPPLHTGQYPLYFELVYDANSNGIPDAGEWYLGWHDKTNRAPGNLLDPLIRPDMEFMYVSINMETTHGTF